MRKSLSIFVRVVWLAVLCAGLGMVPSGVVAAEDESSDSTPHARYTVTRVRSAQEQTPPRDAERLVIPRDDMHSKQRLDDYRSPSLRRHPRHDHRDPTAPADLLHRPYSLGYWEQPHSPVYIIGDSRDDMPAYPSSASYVIVERRPDQSEWVPGHWEEVPITDIVEGEFVEIYHPAIYRQTEDGELELLEVERTTREPKVRIILAKVWVEGEVVMTNSKLQITNEEIDSETDSDSDSD